MTTNIAKDQKSAKGRVAQSTYPFENFDRLFDEFYPSWLRPIRREWGNFPDTALFGDGIPKVDIINRDKEVFVRADLPGVKKDDLDVTLTDSSLTISGHCNCQEERESGDYYCRETRRGDFSRTLNLPAEVDGDKVEAVFNHGVLELTMPKVKQCKRKTVKVQ